MSKTKDLTPIQEVFASEYLKTGKKQKSMLKAEPHLTKEVASVKANRLLKNDNVRAYLKSQAKRSAENIAELANSGKHDSVTLKANIDILDRAGYRPQDDPDTPKTLSGVDQKEYLKQILDAINSGDTVTLERIVLNSDN